MRKFAPILVILLAACSGGPGSSPTDGETGASVAPTVAVAPTDAGGPAPTEAAGGPSAEASVAPSAAGVTTALPADCAKGLGDYLAAIEAKVAAFDPAKSTLGDLDEADRAAHEIAIQQLDANDGRATYSCSEQGLEWAYFDATSPWDAVLVVAGERAPGTVPYLTALQAKAQVDVKVVSDYGVDGCDAAVKEIKQQVKARMKAKKDSVEELGFDDAMQLLGLYKAYMRDVRNEVCPRDKLGNDEWGFMG